MHDFVTHVDRRAERFERALDDLDGAIDAGTESTWVGEQHLHGRHYRAESVLLANNPNSISMTAPTLIAESAMLKAGHDQVP